MQDEGKVEGVTEMSHQGLLVYPQVEEKDWNVLGLVLEKASRSFQNKGMLTRYGKDISKFQYFAPTPILSQIFTP